jgi:DNA-binding MarR family transcriptional regulator
MKDLVRDEDIEIFDALYHLWVRQNIASKSIVPEELKKLSPIDISVINIISSNPDIKIGELAEILNVPNSTLTSSLNRLEKKSIVSRTMNPHDKRSFGIQLTEKGTRIQQIHLEFERAYFESILMKLDTHEERAMLLDMLKKMVYSNQNAYSDRK